MKRPCGVKRTYGVKTRNERNESNGRFMKRPYVMKRPYGVRPYSVKRTCVMM